MSEFLTAHFPDHKNQSCHREDGKLYVRPGVEWTKQGQYVDEIEQRSCAVNARAEWLGQ